MSGSHSNDQRLSGRRTLIAMLAIYLAALVGANCAVWFEMPAAVVFGLRGATLIVALLAAICTGRKMARSQASMAFRDRPSISGRDAGVLAFAALAGVAVLCTKLIFPRSWPMTVDKALAMLDAQLDGESRRRLAYMGYDELVELHHGWGTSIRNQFGMWSGNHRLLRDCDIEYVHPETCSTVIISRFWKKARAELPPMERLPLEGLEARMNRVMVAPRELEELRLKDVVAFFNEAISAQLPEDSRFTVRYAPAYADETVSWHEREPISFHDALGRLAANTGLYVRRTPPDLLLEPYRKPLSVQMQRVTRLKALLAVEHGLPEATRALITDDAEWTKVWRAISSKSSARPLVDFRRNSLLVVSLGTRPSTGYGITVVASGVDEPEVSLLATEVRPGKTCATAKRSTHPTSVFIVPMATDNAQILLGHDTQECTQE